MAHADDASVPSDFPKTPLLAALAGAQPKLPARLVNEQYVVGFTEDELRARFDICQDLVDQLGPYGRRKQTEHPEWTPEGLVAKVAKAVRAKAAAGEEGWDLPEPELRWVLDKVSEQLNQSVGLNRR